MAPSSQPGSITGGCLCGAIRFTISFPKDAEWPPSLVGPFKVMNFTTLLTYSRMVRVSAQCAASTQEAYCLRTVRFQPPIYLPLSKRILPTRYTNPRRSRIVAFAARAEAL